MTTARDFIERHKHTLVKLLLCLGVVGSVLWAVRALKQDEAHRGIRVDSTNAYQEFATRHDELERAYERYYRTPPPSAAERREILERCRILILEIEPRLYRECDHGLAHAITVYKKVRRLQFEQGLATVDGAPKERGSKEVRVQEARRKVVEEMTRVRTELGLRKKE